jgi:cytochrome c peroxidase
LRLVILSAVLAIAILSLAASGGSPQSSSLFNAIGRAASHDGQLVSFANPEVVLGDRLFFETRFSRFFFEHSHGNVNASLTSGDPVVNQVPVSAGESLPGVFRGQSINCRQCHLGDDFIRNRPYAGRTYCDFSRRSPVPDRGDGCRMTVRNSPIMPDLGLPRDVPMLLHFDGEFASPEDLVVDTLSGRNFGWLPKEAGTAVAHIAKIIRGDDGGNPRYVRYSRGQGIPYRVALLGTDPHLPSYLRLPTNYRIDVATATDEQVVYAVAKLMHAYIDSLRFGTRNTLRTSKAPYDLFLEKNHIPTAPKKHESSSKYALRLLRLLNQRKHLEWVTDADDRFWLHNQPYQFGPTELKGLKIFFSRRGGSGPHVGNCVSCHGPPQFTDHRFHNNGVSQVEYDSVFGAGTFAALEVPAMTARNREFDKYLPSSPKHPDATGRFRCVPTPGKAGCADLGVWNILGNPDIPRPQAALIQILCKQAGTKLKHCTPENILPLTLAFFKTPSVRDLGQSYPYFHSGAVDTIEEVVGFYMTTSGLARSGKLRNASPELVAVRIDYTDVAPLVAFLRSLNEDYH